MKAGVLGIIAGNGELPKEVISSCIKQNRKIFVIAFEDITEKETVKNVPHKWVHIGKIGEVIRTLKAHGADEIILAGAVGRPSPSLLQMDFSALKLLRTLSKLSSHGDDKIFSAIIDFLEKKDFNVVGADDILNELLIKKEILGDIIPDKIAQNDIALGLKSALKVGELDIGQAVIIQQGQILGVEAAEGTDRLIKRCKELHAQGKGGVLVKMKKPTQDRRVDLPSIGVNTVEIAHASGLRGIAVEAGSALVINKEKVIAKANELGIFIVGVEKNKSISPPPSQQ